MGAIALRGTAGAPGIAVGPVWRFRPAEPTSERENREPFAHADDDGGAIRAAAEQAARELEALAARVRSIGRPDDAAIFEAQALMAIDPMLLDEAVRRVEAGDPPARAVLGAATTAAARLAEVDGELIAARAADVRDVGARIGRVLAGETLALPAVPSIVLASDLPPSVTAEIPDGFLLGVALAGGSRTAHAVILARGLGIPAIVGIDGLLAATDTAATEVGSSALTAALDGDTGAVILTPSSSDIDEFRVRSAERARLRAKAASLRDRPATTADGEWVKLLANIGQPAEVPRALAAGAEGIGLFRTEFLFMRRETPPTELEQAAAYRRVLEAFGPERPVVIRLADIGGDKSIPYLALPPEANPFLGVRAIRLAYHSPDLLRSQFRAIWRAGGLAGVTPHVMAPMVATIADVELYRALRDEARAELLAEGSPCAREIATGIMIEVPSAAILTPALARLVDFFSIGTNDLTQYLMAADRGNAALATLQDALHPAVLMTIKGVVAAADAAHIPVAVCGELAGDPAGALVLVGLGVRELSADAGSLDGVRSALLTVARVDLAELASAALAAPDAAMVRALASTLLARAADRPVAAVTS